MKPTSNVQKQKISPAKSITTGITIDLIFLLMSGLILDGGQIQKMLMVAIAAHAAGAFIIIQRRGDADKFTKWDEYFVAFGCLLTIFLEMVVFGVLVALSRS